MDHIYDDSIYISFIEMKNRQRNFMQCAYQRIEPHHHSFGLVIQKTSSNYHYPYLP